MIIIETNSLSFFSRLPPGQTVPPIPVSFYDYSYSDQPDKIGKEAAELLYKEN